MKNTLESKNYVYLFVIVLLIFPTSCKKDNAVTNPPANINVPVVSTDTVSSITNNTAVCGGTITSDGGAAVTARGVCWGTSEDPTVDSSKTTDGTGTGSFASNISGLTAGTKYYVKAYATNNAGTGYGNAVSFTTKQESNDTTATWLEATSVAEFSPRNAHQVVEYGGTLWLIGRPDQQHFDVWNSTNAIHWTKITDNLNIAAPFEYYALVFNDKIWLFPDSNEVWNSSDGKSWSKVAVSNYPLYDEKVPIVFKNKIWLTGGWSYTENINNLKVWNSDDGTNWNQVNISTTIPNRCYHSLVVFNEKLWLIAGYNGSHLNDVWCTEDGINWQLVTSHAGFPARHCSQVKVFKDKMWLIGGMSVGDYFVNDVWYSENGNEWTKSKTISGFAPRMEHQVVAFNDTLWVIGGLTGDVINNNMRPMNDIWYTVNP